MFGAFKLDAARLVLSCDGEPVPTTPRILSTLLYFVENRGRTLGKTEMLDALWPGRIVEEANLSQAVSTLRKTLATCGAADLITTVPGRGYRFVGQVGLETSDKLAPPRSSPALGPTQATGGPKRGFRFRTAIRLAAACSAALVAVVIWGLEFRSSKLVGERTGIVIADPQNFTGDAAFDHVVTQILRASLDQSPTLQVASDTEVAETLALMEQPQSAALTFSKARAVCARINGGAVVAPMLSRVQSHYVLTLSASSCMDGRTLVDEKAEADDKEAVVRLLSKLTTRMRRQLGEVRSSIARYDVPLAPERTSSFEALRAFSEAEALMRQGRRLDAIPLYQHATQLDPDFAMAYYGLSQVYYEFFQTEKDAIAITQAYHRVALVSERDALMIREHYNSAVTRDLDAARDNMELLTRLYPRDASAWRDLSEVRYRLADYAGAAAAGEQGLRLDPKNSGAYTVLARALNHLQQTARAEQLDRQALKEVPETDQIRQQRIAWRFMQGDSEGGKRLVASALGTPIEREALLEASNFAFADGRVTDAARLVERANALGRIRGLSPDYTREAESYLAVGLDTRARAALAQVPAEFWNGQDDYFAARLDEPAKAQAALQRDLAERPHDTLLTGEYAPEARAALLLRRGQPLQAAKMLESVDRFMFHDLDAPFLRGTALMAAKDGRGAAVVFRSILAQTGFSWNPQFAMSHLGLARALRLQGDMVGSRREYRAFLADWGSANPELPALKEAKAEYATLETQANFRVTIHTGVAHLVVKILAPENARARVPQPHVCAGQWSIARGGACKTLHV